MYDDFIEHIDGIDNGVENRTGDLNYKVSTTLSSRVRRLNPPWNDANFDTLKNKAGKEKYISDCFLKAVTLTTHEFVECFENMIKVWLPARKIVVKAVEDRFSVHSSGEIIKLAHFGKLCCFSRFVF